MLRQWERFDDGVALANELLEMLGDPIAKASNPLTRSGYDALLRSLLRAIGKEADAADLASLKTAADKLDRDWPNLSRGEQERIIRAAMSSILKVPRVIVPQVTRVLATHGAQIVTVTKRAMAATYPPMRRIQAAFDAVDKRVIAHAAKSQASYITDQYSRRVESISARAREIVSKGMEAGLGRAEIGKDLRDLLMGPGMRTSKAYWETVASIHISRARSWAELASLDEAGIERFMWQSVLDEVTSEQCRFMNGREFSVPAARQRYLDVEASEDPEAVKQLQPWIRIGKTEDGDQFLYTEVDGRRTRLADVKEPGYGTRDKVGKYDRAAPEEKLQRLGVMTPPAHPRCRSTIVPA